MNKKFPLDKRPYKDAAYSYIAQVAQALAQGHRLELLDLLANGEKRVDEIAAEAGLSVANASRHLQILRQAGNARYYRLARPEVHALWLALLLLTGATTFWQVAALSALLGLGRRWSIPPFWRGCPTTPHRSSAPKASGSFACGATWATP